LFFLERKGILQSKMLLKTEYSVIVGESYFGMDRVSGLLNFQGSKYTFKLDSDGLKILDSHKENVFSFNIHNTEALDLFEFCALLFASAIVTHKYLVKHQLARAV
jgi:hypothetical protein